MARTPEPLEIAKLKGAVRHDPQRYREVPDGAPGVAGAPPAHLSPSAKLVWYELLEIIPRGIATPSERLILETLSDLVVEYRADPPAFSSAKHTVMGQRMSELGMGGASRRKLAAPSKPKENAFSQFVNTRQ